MIIMNQFKGTQGPWKVVINDDNTPDIISDSGVEIAYTPTYNGDKTEQLANARLIAAAPELLEALQLCEEFMSYLPSTGFDGLARIEGAREAIKKAIGE